MVPIVGTINASDIVTLKRVPHLLLLLMLLLEAVPALAVAVAAKMHFGIMCCPVDSKACLRCGI